MSTPHLDSGPASPDEPGHPYEGKHRAPEPRLLGLRRSVARVVLGHPTAPPPQPPAPPQLPDPPGPPGSDSPEVPHDQQDTDDQR
jgi:hypothetical protein